AGGGGFELEVLERDAGEACGGEFVLDPALDAFVEEMCFAHAHTQARRAAQSSARRSTAHDPHICSNDRVTGEGRNPDQLPMHARPIGLPAKAIGEPVRKLDPPALVRAWVLLPEAGVRPGRRCGYRVLPCGWACAV